LLEHVEAEGREEECKRVFEDQVQAKRHATMSGDKRKDERITAINARLYVEFYFLFDLSTPINTSTPPFFVVCSLLYYVFVLSSILYKLSPFLPTAVLPVTAAIKSSVHQVELEQDLVTVQNQGSLPLAQCLDLLFRLL
jgi:hypothetical protein